MSAATEEEASVVLKAVADGNVEALSQVLASGADANAQDRWGTPVLCRASGRGEPTAVRLLLDHGGDPNLASRAGNSPLMVAAASGHLDIVRMLVEAGAEVAAKNQWGLSATDWAKWAVDPAEIKAALSVGHQKA